MDFFYNKGYEHRGVWHYTENLRIEQKPERRHSYDHDIYDWKNPVARKDRVDGAQYYDHKSSMGIPSSWSYLKPDDPLYLILGQVHKVVVTPAHEAYFAAAACGSVSTNGYGHTTNLRNITGPTDKRSDIGKTITYFDSKVVKAPIESDATVPPEPFCRHCEKILIKRGLITTL